MTMIFPKVWTNSLILIQCGSLQVSGFRWAILRKCGQIMQRLPGEILTFYLHHKSLWPNSILRSKLNPGNLSPRKAREQKHLKKLMSRQHFLEKQQRLNAFNPINESHWVPRFHLLGYMFRIAMYVTFMWGICFDFRQPWTWLSRG